MSKSSKPAAGHKPKGQSFFRPTGMSVAMAAAGIIPDVHLVRELALTGLLRNKHDNSNSRPSVNVAF